MKDQYLFLYQKFLDNNCSHKELDLLFNYFETANEQELKRLISAELQAVAAVEPATEREAERLAVMHQLVKTHINQRKFKIRKLAYHSTAAAAIIIALTFGIRFSWHPARPVPVNKQQAVVITPGRRQATLILANGKKVVLNTAMAGTLARLGNISVQISQSQAYHIHLKITVTARPLPTIL